MAKKKLTDAELKQAAARRAMANPRQGIDVSSLFATYGTRAVEPQTYRLPVVRVSETLGRRVAAYGNRHHLSVSQTIRRLVEIGLDAEGEP